MAAWILRLVQSAGAAGVGLLMLLENVVVFIPSELIMPLAGFYSAIGRLNFWASVVAGTIGAHLGSLCWYFLGRYLGKERFEEFVRRHGAWVGIEARHVEKATRWFEGRGAMAILIGRLLPAIRTFISVPAGFARMPLTKFVPLSLAGTLVFNFLLAEAGRLLGAHFREVELWIRPVSLTIVGVLFAWWLYRVVRAHI
ncbi:MAG TPA: DedA family protein [Thermoanaerobaculia bacterium]|nr:DedA family protein [Thermoanaerobaculia bacterium]